MIRARLIRMTTIRPLSCAGRNPNQSSCGYLLSGWRSPVGWLPGDAERLSVMREFDLNIETMLENWTVAHALREVIANALDEQALTGTGEPQISQDDLGRWHVRDWGRGLRYEHLTQNENQEKLAQPDRVVGKFGVGLKDALALTGTVST